MQRLTRSTERNLRFKSEKSVLMTIFTNSVKFRVNVKKNVLAKIKLSFFFFFELY